MSLEDINRLNNELKRLKEELFEARVKFALSTDEEEKTRLLNYIQELKHEIADLMLIIECYNIGRGKENDKYKRR